jgi:hypothetical protein
VLTCLEHNRGRWLQSQTTGLFCRRVCALRASASELAGVDQRCCGAMSALLLCMDRFLQLCSGLEHNHQKVTAGRSVLSLGRGRALRVSASELACVEQSCGGRCPRCRCTNCGAARGPCVVSGQQPADSPSCQQAQIFASGLLNFSPMRATFGDASGWGKHERRSRSANDVVACLNRGTRHLPPVSARRHVVKGGTLGQKMRPARRSRPTRASEWQWVIIGGEPSAARRVLRSSEGLQQLLAFSHEPSQGESLKPDESEGCSPVSGGRTTSIELESDFARLGHLTTLLPRFDPR